MDGLGGPLDPTDGDEAGMCEEPGGAERPMDQNDIHGTEAQDGATGSQD